LDEQNTLIRPLVSRKLHLIKILDERSSLIEKLLEDKRRKFLANSVMSPGRRTPVGGNEQLGIIEKLEDEIEQIAHEKVTICMQLMDLVKRPFETILEVESTLRIAAERDGVNIASPTASAPVEQQRQSMAAPSSRSNRQSTSGNVIAQPAVSVAAPPDEELWCFCRKPDDGRQMVACDNPKCDVSWWHIDCLENYISTNRIGTTPTEDAKWMCPICIAAEIVSREEAAAAGGGEKRRRARRA